MREREPEPAGSKEDEPGWNSDALARALGATPRERRDVALGRGWQLHHDERVAEGLEIFPEASAVRLTTLDARLEVYRLAGAVIHPQGVIFERRGDTESLRLSVTARGDVTLSIVPNKTDEEPPPGPASDVVKDSPVSREQERVTLLGRVGATPSFRTSPKGTLIGRFPLAVHCDDQSTSWHTILAFGERAKKLQGSLTKGQQAEVIGYRHEREQHARDGRTKVVEEIYAVAIKAR